MHTENPPTRTEAERDAHLDRLAGLTRQPYTSHYDDPWREAATRLDEEPFQ